MSDEQFIYAVARIRSKELGLLDNTAIDQLLSSKSYEECFRLLLDKGWGRTGEESAEQLLAVEREKTWDLMNELVEDMSVFDTFLYGNDFHNLKAAIKLVYTDKEVPNIFLSNTTIQPDVLLDAVKRHDFTVLPKYMQECAEEAYQVIMHTGDGQLSDIIIDKAALDTVYKKANESNNELFEIYGKLKVVAADINIAIRGCKTKKNTEFFKKALAECDSLDIKKLSDAALSGEEAIYEYLSNTEYADAVSAIKESPSAFERWCDNLIIRHIKPQKYNPFSVSPLAAYILARENEIKSVRILLSGKLNELPEDLIRERLREMYV